MNNAQAWGYLKKVASELWQYAGLADKRHGPAASGETVRSGMIVWPEVAFMGLMASMDARGYVVRPGEGVAGSGPDVKATAAVTAGSLTVMESTVKQGPPRHVHAHEDECFYVLDGTVTVFCGDDTFEAPSRSFVFLPRGIPHTFHAENGEAGVLFIAVPGGIEHYFHEINQAASPQEQERIGTKYDIRVV